MRIIAGNSKINILSDQQNNSDFIVLAEVIDSMMGYEKPILVKNSRDLLIWFGDKFKEYNYFKELLDEDNVCLYLYRGIETEASDKYIIDKYYYIPDVSPNTPETLAALEDSTCFWVEGAENNINLLPEIGEEDCLYKVIRSDGVNYDPEYNIRYSYYQYAINSGSYLLYDSLDETLKIKSLQNRDRLSIGYYKARGQNTILTYSYYNPGMDYVSLKNPGSGSVIVDDFDEFQETVLSGHATRHFRISGKEVTEESLKKDPHIPLKEDGTYEIPKLNGRQLTYFYEEPIGYSMNSGGHGGIVITPDTLYVSNKIKCNCLVEDSSLTNIPSSLAVEGFNGVYQNVVINRRPVPVNLIEYNGIEYSDIIEIDSTLSPSTPDGSFRRFGEFYNMPKGFKVEPDFLLDQKDIYDYYVDGGEVYRFESKTIGKGSEDIKVEIKWIETYTEKNNIYSVTISRYDYQEFYEGPLEDEFGYERLDYKISRDSKLVRFKIIPATMPEGGWPEGEWELKGAYAEESCNSEYSFNLMCKSLEDFPPDFVLVPNKGKAPSENRILDWTETLNCQALITNNKDDVEGNLDLGEDLENRLIHFYNQIRYDGEYRPGYYIFLKSLLSQDRYIPNSTRIVYHFPEDELDSKDENYEETVENFYEKLERYRSNSLSLNNYYYYYDYYFPGENYSTTPLVRFVISKITRELEKNKWKIIGEKANKVSEDTMYPILRAIQGRFSIIRSIEINNFIVDGISRTVEASITTTLSDIISSDVSFDIILNYSKLNN